MAEHANDDAAPVGSNQTAATEEEETVERTTEEEEEERLRYLEFLQQAAAQAYSYAEQRAGPVYNRVHALSLDLLNFLDGMVRRETILAAAMYLLVGILAAAMYLLVGILAAAVEAMEEKLRHLEYVVLAAATYAHVKQGLGPHRPSVDSVEGTAEAVVGPVDRCHASPLGPVKFLCHKVVEYIPPVVREAPTLACSAAAEVRRSGVMGTAAGLAKSAISRAEPMARELYTRYEPMAERRVAQAWVVVNRLPLVPSVTRAVLPTATQLSIRYNSAVRDGAERGSTVATYLPLVPTERLARVFGNPMAAPTPEMQPIPSQ